MAAEIINLRRARKQKLRANKEATAALNRKRFGRTKGETRLEEGERERQFKTIESHRREGDMTDDDD